jgi:hypothetical protein
MLCTIMKSTHCNKFINFHIRRVHDMKIRPHGEKYPGRAIISKCIFALLREGIACCVSATAWGL